MFYCYFVGLLRVYADQVTILYPTLITITLLATLLCQKYGAVFYETILVEESLVL